MMRPQSPEDAKKLVPVVSSPEGTGTTRESGSRISVASDRTLLLDEVNAKLRDIPGLTVEHGSPIVLEYCTQAMLDMIEDNFSELGLPFPRMRVERNKLCLEEYSISTEHEEIARAFDYFATRYNTSISGDFSDPLRLQGSASYDMSFGAVQPDCRYEVRRTPARNCPNMVVEIAISQTLEDLHHKCLRYLNESSNVLVAIAVKVFAADNFVDRVLLAMVYIRNADGQRVEVPETAVSFGPAVMSLTLTNRVMQVTHVAGVSGFVEGKDPLIPCDRPGIEQYLLTINHQLLLAINDEGGDVAPHHVNAPDLVMDLYHVLKSLR
jgi:hypothetical protein